MTRTEAGSWAPRTQATYTADWALFVDWCDATDHEPLPADPTIVLEFLADCPAAAATRRRRVIAIDHHHATVGHPPPGADPCVRDVLGRPPTGLPPVTAETRARVDAALRMLPSRGWTGGLFGQRDRCLLVLSQLGRIPHRHLAQLMAGDVAVADGVATITATGRTTRIEAVEDPVLCGPCAIARWLHTHEVIVTRIATPAIADHLRTAETPTSTSPHVCRTFRVSDEGTSASPMLAPASQWGHTAFPLGPMSPHAVSRQARDLLDGIIVVHRDLPGHPPTEMGPATDAQPAVGPPGYTRKQWRAALDRRQADIVELSGIADELAAVDERVATLDRRIRELLALAMKQ